MLNVKAQVSELSAGDSEAMPEALARRGSPVVVRGMVADWPLVDAAQRSGDEAMSYLANFYEDATVGAFFGEPGQAGRVFYNADYTGFNYKPVLIKFDDLLNKLREHRRDESTPFIYMGSTTVDACLPGLRAANDLDFGQYQPLASIWMGNRSRIAAHYDLPENLACNAAGRRRFILFPPDQLKHLYVGPLDLTPAGQPISLVDFAEPDFGRFPLFREALAHAQVAELAPGDAIFIPSMWWHHVEALENFNVLINYWWRQTPAFMGPPLDVLMHALLTLRDLPQAQKDAWRGIFEHYVFDSSGSDFSHIPQHLRGVLAPMDDSKARKIRGELLNRLNR